ncbi:MAG: CDP-diacylglycerol--serine O-phosphatidyltransferase [Alphaproteobacteria bacterium]|nr:CDP-diacylglycerol--serine O-phosphatidyltransferase [Alphaproteobacteria bacterium]
MKPSLNGKIKLPKGKLSEIPFRKLVPNIVTMLALCSGLTSIRYSVQDDWHRAVLFIFLAGLLDGLDGRIARLLKASSKFGAELDSLCDFVSFGIAPAILMFQWCLFDLPKIGWFFCLLYSMGMAMRLARFNAMLEDETVPPYWANYFTGVPAPAAAALALMPILITFDFVGAQDFLRSHLFCSFWMCIVSYLETSRIPTLSLKKTKIKTTMVIPLLIVVALTANFLFTQTWLALGVLTAIYALFIPYGVISFMKEKRAYLEQIETAKE